MFQSSPGKVNIRGHFEAQRRQAINRHRLGNGLRSLRYQPWRLVFPGLVVTLTIAAYLNRSFVVNLLPGCDIYPELATLWGWVTAALVIVVGILALLGVLALMGRPKHAKRIEAGLTRVGLKDQYDIGPALLRSRPMSRHSQAQTLDFYSAGIAKETWEKHQAAIEDALNVTYIEPPTYGKYHGKYHRNYISLTVTPGTGVKRAEPLYDDEL